MIVWALCCPNEGPLLPSFFFVGENLCSHLMAIKPILHDTFVCTTCGKILFFPHSFLLWVYTKIASIDSRFLPRLYQGFKIVEMDSSFHPSTHIVKTLLD